MSHRSDENASKLCAFPLRERARLSGINGELMLTRDVHWVQERLGDLSTQPATRLKHVSQHEIQNCSITGGEVKPPSARIPHRHNPGWTRLLGGAGAGAIEQQLGREGAVPDRNHACHRQRRKRSHPLLLSTNKADKPSCDNRWVTQEQSHQVQTTRSYTSQRKRTAEASARSHRWRMWGRGWRGRHAASRAPRRVADPPGDRASVNMSTAIKSVSPNST